MLEDDDSEVPHSSEDFMRTAKGRGYVYCLLLPLGSRCGVLLMRRT